MLEELLNKLGRRIRILRKQRNLTQEELSERAQISYKFLGEIERGLKNSSIKTLGKIADAMEISLAELLYFPANHDPQTERIKNEIFGLITNRDIPNLKKTLKILEAYFEE